MAFLAGQVAGVSVVRLRRREVPDTGHWPSSVHPVLQRVYAARGIGDPSQVQTRLGALLAPHTLGGLETAVALLSEAIASHARICIVGDFDADGATGTAVAVRGLRMLGAKHVTFRVPHRMTHGYGLSPALVADLLTEEKPELIVTVDNGVASLAGVAAANAADIRVIVTDHHLPGPQLPDCVAIVNPNLAGDGFPSKALAGVGVMFYLLLALRAHLRGQGAYTQTSEPDLTALLDLVALGTVADLVPLDANNRILIAAGLRRIRAGLAQPGIAALIEVSGRKAEKLDAADLGFALGPRLNAAGRLEDMAIGIQCLVCDDKDEARELASLLDGINRERRDVQARMLEDAHALVPDIDAEHQAAVCVFAEDWHPGVVGLVASKLKENLHRPAIAFAPGGDDGLLRGSARSIPGFHIRDALADIAARHPALIERLGGHAMAAGLSLTPEKLDEFRTAFAAYAAEKLDAATLRAELLSDGALAPCDMTRELADLLREAGPWGQGFPEPVFDDEFTVEGWRRVGHDHLKLQLRHPQAGMSIGAIWFGGWRGEPPPPRIHAAYQLKPDDFRDRGGVQLLIQGLF